MFKTPIAAASALLVLLMAALPANAATPEGDTVELASMSLDKLLDMPVTGGSKFTATVASTAASVTVITQDEIRALGLRSLPEVLATIKGVMITSDREYSYIGVRGFYAPGDFNTRVLMLVDGNRVNDALFDQAYLGSEFPLDIEQVERVEFIPGQGSAVYGANALFGVINVVTRHATQASAPIVEATVGSFGEHKARAGSTLALGDALVKWSASDTTVRGEDVDANGAVVPHGDYLRRKSFSLDVRMGEVSFSAINGWRAKGQPDMLGSVPGELDGRGTDTEGLYNLAWTHITQAGDNVLVRLYEGQYQYVGRYSFDGEPGLVNEDDARVHWWGGEARLTTNRIADHKLTLGAEFQSSPLLSQFNGDIQPTPVTYLNVHDVSQRSAVFVEDQAQLGERWMLDSSVRFDRTADYSNQASERIALFWRPTDNLVAKAIYGTAYRNPNDFESQYLIAGEGGFTANPNLGTERVRGVELNVEWSPSKADSVSVSTYQNDARQLIVAQFDPTTQTSEFINQGRVVARGIEAEWHHTWESGARLRANVSHVEAVDQNVTTPIGIYAPHYLANATFSVPVPHDIVIGGWWRAVSARGAASAYTLSGLAVSSQTQEQPQAWWWSLKVSNLFNRAYNDPGSDLVAQPTISQAGRSFELSIGRGF